MAATTVTGREVFANAAAATITSGGTDAPAAGTSQSWTADVTAAFAETTSSGVLQQFYIADPAAPSEMMLVTTCPGGTGGSQSWTVTRGADGTTPVTHTSGFAVKQVLTRASLESVQSPPLNAVADYGADNSGATDCYTAVHTMLTAAAAADGPVVCYFPAGTYSHSEGWTVPPNVTITGDFITGNATVGSLTGTVFEPRSTFTGSYAFYVPDAGAAITNGPVLRHLGINGTNHTSSSVDGIQFYGPTLSAVVDDVRIIYMSGWGLNFLQDSGSDTEQFPFGLEISNVYVDTCGGGGSAGGVNAYWCEDSTFYNVYVIGCEGPGWVIESCDNTKFIACRGEWNSTYGWHITGDWSYACTGACQFIGCSTDRNTYDGFYVDATTADGGDGTGVSPLLFTNLATHRDGSAGGTTYAGLRVNGASVPVIVNGIAQSTGDNDGGGGNMSPYYGCYVEGIGSVPVLVSGGLVWGVNTAFGTSGTVTGLQKHGYVPVTGDGYSPVYGTYQT
jgi:hypothetical protein